MKKITLTIIGNLIFILPTYKRQLFAKRGIEYWICKSTKDIVFL